MLQEQSYCFCISSSTAPVVHCVVKRAVIILDVLCGPSCKEQPQHINTAALNSSVQRSQPIEVARGVSAASLSWSRRRRATSTRRF